MDRRAFLTLVVGGLLAAPLAPGAQQTGRMPQIGVLLPAEPASPTEPNASAFRQGLRDLGYVEGKDIAIDYRYAHGRSERYAELAHELVQLKVDVLVAGGNASYAAWDVTHTIPIVSIAAADLIGTGLVTSLARPGGNLTGLSLAQNEGISKKWVQLLKEAAPRVSRVGLLRDASAPLQPKILTDTETAAAALGLKFRVLEVRELQELDGVFAGLSKERGYGLIVGGTPLFFPHRSRIHELAIKHGLPAIYAWRVFVDAGGLMSYGASLSDLWRRAATYVDKILKGAKPGDLPVEDPTKFELVINLNAAKALGLTIPQSLLLRADQVIE
jgi:putative ABC transport system substrate-binding protein